MRLYYYTGKQWGMKSLWEKRLKIARYEQVNDPFELAPFNLQKKKSREFWRKKVQRFIRSKTGVICFSEDWRTTLMWAHYGEKHTGLCLGFDVPDHEAHKVEYIDALMDDPLDHGSRDKGVTSDLFLAALRYKSHAWAYEREWRLRVPLTNPLDGIYYKNFDDTLHLREVIIGPSCSMQPSDIVDAVRNPPLDVEIFKARAAFGRFEICRHREVHPHLMSGYRARLALAPDVFHDQLPEEADEQTEEGEDLDPPPW